MASSLRCRCGSQKTKGWHLVCPTCWAKVPPALQAEVYDAYKEQQGSTRHITAVRQALRSLGPIGGAK